MQLEKKGKALEQSTMQLKAEVDNLFHKLKLCRESLNNLEHYAAQGENALKLLAYLSHRMKIQIN